MAAKPLYYYLKKGFVPTIADFITVPVAHWRKVKLTNLNRQWFIFGWQPYQVRAQPEQQPLEDLKTYNAGSLLTNSSDLSRSPPFRKVTTEEKCPVLWFQSTRLLFPLPTNLMNISASTRCQRTSSCVCCDTKQTWIPYLDCSVDLRSRAHCFRLAAWREQGQVTHFCSEC